MHLQIENLSKTYPNGTKALDQISLTIKKGMFGLLGPNGAGKSTLMRTVATLQQADSGLINLNGENIFQHKMEIRKNLGYLPQEFGVYPRMSASKLLDYLAQLKGIHIKKERQALVEKCLEITNLSDVGKKAVSGYSGGMRQRFGIAQVLLNNPQLIIVDEPTAGLDPAERQRFLNILREIGKNNIVIFSTHIVEDIKDLCTDMAIMKGGKILEHCSPQQAIEQLNGKIFTADIREEDLEHYEDNLFVLSSQYNTDNSVRIRVHSLESPSSNFSISEPSLEDYYFTILNRDHV